MSTNGEKKALNIAIMWITKNAKNYRKSFATESTQNKNHQISWKFYNDKNPHFSFLKKLENRITLLLTFFQKPKNSYFFAWKKEKNKKGKEPWEKKNIEQHGLDRRYSFRHKLAVACRNGRCSMLRMPHRLF